MNPARLAVLGAIGLAILIAGSRLEATTVVRMDAAELSDQADLIFTGIAVQKKVLSSKDGLFPFTFVTFTVDDVVKGGTLWKEITLRFDGGDLGDLKLEVEGMPRFEEGESYLLFVKGNGSVGCPVVGWWQGQFRYTTKEGSKKRILVDSAGVPVEGIDRGRFKREWAEEAQVSHGASVVSVEGVEIPTPQKLQHAKVAVDARLADTPDAGHVVDQLRSFIAGRAPAKNLRPGLMVQSARPEDVPEHVDWSAARAPELQILGKETRP